MKVRLPLIRHDQAGFSALVRLNAATENYYLDDIEIDLGQAHSILMF